jgi:hypothetical protein
MQRIVAKNDAQQKDEKQNQTIKGTIIYLSISASNATILPEFANNYGSFRIQSLPLHSVQGRL